jgi:chloride channel protein, CIC family
MRELQASCAGSSLAATVATCALGGVVGGSAAAVLVVGVTEMIKAMLAVVSRQDTWALILVPQLGLALSVLVLY